jgi:transposase
MNTQLRKERDERGAVGHRRSLRADHRASAADGQGQFLYSGWRFRTTVADLARLWAKLPVGTEVVVIMEPTRNAWVPLAAWLRARGAKVVLVPPEQSADLRDYYNKHAKTDRLDSRMLARIPLLHPDGLRAIDDLGPADSLRRAVRHRASLVRRHTAALGRLDALVELLGPEWAEALGSGNYVKSALVILENGRVLLGRAPCLAAATASQPRSAHRT